MTNLAKTAQILLAAHAEFSALPVGANGQPNGNATNAVQKRLEKALKAAGEEYPSYVYLASDLRYKVWPSTAVVLKK